MESKFNITAKINKLNQAKVDLPKLIANIGQTFFQLNFDKQQWNGVAWAQRKAGNWYTNKMVGHALLVGRTGDLRRAMQNTIKSFNWSKIVWAVKDVSYAQYINEGTPNMPARKIMGYNDEMMKLVTRKIESEFKKIMQHEK